MVSHCTSILFCQRPKGECVKRGYPQSEMEIRTVVISKRQQRTYWGPYRSHEIVVLITCTRVNTTRDRLVSACGLKMVYRHYILVHTCISERSNRYKTCTCTCIYMYYMCTCIWHLTLYDSRHKMSL